MNENALTRHHLARIEASVAAISAALKLNRRDAYAYAYTRGRADAVTGAVRNKNINNTTDENKTKQVNKIDRGGLPESINPPIGLSEVVGAAESLMKIPGWYAAWWHRYMSAAGWRTNRGESVSRENWRPLLMTWWRNCRDEERERIRRESLAPRRVLPEAAVEASHDWRLCAERCANCREGGGCGRGVAVPPAWQARPHPPEECPRFAAKSF